jgi:hypothetical protein
MHMCQGQRSKRDIRHLDWQDEEQVLCCRYLIDFQCKLDRLGSVRNIVLRNGR